MSETAAGYGSDDAAIARENYARFRRARDAGHTKFIEEAVKFERFYEGDQWDAADAAKLKAERRPAQTINLTLSTINTMAGEFINRQADFQFKPKRGPASEESAQILTKAVLSVTDTNHLEYKEQEAIQDGLITGRGYFDCRISFEENVLGEIDIDTRDPREVVLDPTARDYDPNTWNEVSTTKWLSLDEIEATYGKEKAEALRHKVTSGSIIAEENFVFDENPTFGNTDVVTFTGVDDTRETGRTLRLVRVIDRQYYKLTRVREAIDPVSGEARMLPESWSKERVELYVQAKNLYMRERTGRRIRWTVSADCVLLHDSWSPYRTFTIVPFFCYFRRGRPFGAVKNLIGPQEILNKVESQKLHVVNTTANSGWIVDSGALLNMTVEELETKGAETGLVIEKAPQSSVEKIKPNPIPTGLDRIGVMSADWLREISGVNAAMLGMEDSEVSGVALRNKQLRGSLQMQTIVKNVKLTRQLLARKIVELIQMFYTEERLLYIVGPDGDTEELLINQRNAAGEILNDLTAGEYTVVVGSMPARDNFEDSQFAQALELREVGVAVPDHRVIQYSGLHRKQELIAEVKQITGFGEPTEMDQQVQQLQLQMLQAQVQDLMADIEAKHAAAQLSLAKANSEAQQPAIERERMQHEMVTTQVEQATRTNVQRLKEMSSQLQSLMDARVKTQVSKDRIEQAKLKPAPRSPSNGNKQPRRK